MADYVLHIPHEIASGNGYRFRQAMEDVLNRLLVPMSITKAHVRNCRKSAEKESCSQGRRNALGRIWFRWKNI